MREEGDGRRTQLKKNDITCAVRVRETERGWEAAWMNGVSESKQGETALDGLAAEQMWIEEERD